MSAAFDYSGLQGVATTLITKFGRPINLRRSSQVPADGAKPWAARESDAVATDDIVVATTGVFLDTIRGEETLTSLGLARPASSTIEQASQLLISNDPLLPSEVGPDWYVDDGSRRWEILTLDLVKPGPTLLFYDLSVRL